MARKSSLVIVILIFVLILSALAFAQAEKTQNAPTKIAVINTEAFYDKETGIKEIVEANNKLEAEFKPQIDELEALKDTILKLEKEIKELNLVFF
jgi:Skp family chaperone for outer membrane proteins